MNCPECGCFMARLVESHRVHEIGPQDELLEKQTVHFYNQCNRGGCRYAEADGIEVEEQTLPYYAVFIEEAWDDVALREGY